MNYWHILIAVVFVSLYELLAHWFPWSMFLRMIGSKEKELHNISRYTIGVIGFLVPIIAVLVYWQDWKAILLISSVVVAAGGSVAVAYLFDHAMHRETKLKEMEERYAAEEAQGRPSQGRLHS